MIYRLFGLMVLLLSGLAGCNPTFNWRETHWAQDKVLKAMLPCKPDEGSRPMNVSGQVLTLHMMGCETGASLFVVAVVDVKDVGHAVEVQGQWQRAMLGNMKATEESASQKQEHFSLRGASEQPAPIRVHAQGQRDNGHALSAQALWFARGGRLYHAAVYADKLDAEVTQTFFEGLRFP